MKVIWNYPINMDYGLGRPIKILVPRSRNKLVLAEMRDGSPTLWYEHTQEQSLDLEGVYVAVFGTGQDIPLPYIHLASIKDGDYFWHVYEIKEPHSTT